MGNHAATIVAAAEGAMSAFPVRPQVLVGFFIVDKSAGIPTGTKKTAGPTPCRFPDYEFLGLLFIDGFLQFGPRGKFRDLAGSDLDGGARLRIAPVPRLSL